MAKNFKQKNLYSIDYIDGNLLYQSVSVLAVNFAEATKLADMMLKELEGVEILGVSKVGMDMYEPPKH